MHGMTFNNAHSFQSLRSVIILSCEEIVRHMKLMLSAMTGLMLLFCSLAVFIGIQLAGKTDGDGHNLSKAL